MSSPCLPITSVPPSLSFSSVFYKAVPTQDVSHPSSRPFHYMYDTPFSLTLTHTISPTVLHPSPAPHFKSFQVFQLYFSKCPSFSTVTLQM
jgi:hypothetical protein